MLELTAKQQKFVAEYLVDGNGARAAIAAGYGHAGAKVRAHRLTRRNPAVQAEIARRQAMDTQRLELDRTAVISGILAGIELAKERMDAATVIRGWAELARLMGFYAPERRQIEVVEGVDTAAELQRYAEMSDAELRALVAS